MLGDYGNVNSYLKYRVSLRELDRDVLLFLDQAVSQPAAGRGT
ncbi:MAG: hypothetical protein ACXVHB_10130 [Solirubrobacteraceae bacterium]